MVVQRQAGQQDALRDLWPCILPRCQPPGPPQGALLDCMRPQGREQAEQFLRVLGLQDQGVVSWYGIVLPGAACGRHTAGRAGGISISAASPLGMTSGLIPRGHISCFI